MAEMAEMADIAPERVRWRSRERGSGALAVAVANERPSASHSSIAE